MALFTVPSLIRTSNRSVIASVRLFCGNNGYCEKYTSILLMLGPYCTGASTPLGNGAVCKVPRFPVFSRKLCGVLRFQSLEGGLLLLWLSLPRRASRTVTLSSSLL